MAGKRGRWSRKKQREVDAAFNRYDQRRRKSKKHPGSDQADTAMPSRKRSKPGLPK